MKSSLIKKLLLSLTFILSFFLGNLAVQAGDYPDRPISVVVAYNPGGATDFQATTSYNDGRSSKKRLFGSAYCYY